MFDCYGVPSEKSNNLMSPILKILPYTRYGRLIKRIIITNFSLTSRKEVLYY